MQTAEANMTVTKAILHGKMQVGKPLPHEQELESIACNSNSAQGQQPGQLGLVWMHSTAVGRSLASCYAKSKIAPRSACHKMNELGPRGGYAHSPCKTYPCKP